MSLPRDLLDEVEIEIDAARRSLAYDCTRTALLEELHRLVIAVDRELDRPITVFDFIRSAATRNEREHRLALVRQLRTDIRDQKGNRNEQTS